MIKLILILILTFLVYFSHGQTSTFSQLDLVTSSDAKELVTDKISFLKNNNLDIRKSKPTLDSIIWFLLRHPKIIISLTLMTAKTDSLKNADSQLRREQSKQIVNYLSKKEINAKRIVSSVSYAGQNPNDDQTVKIRIRVLSQDFSGAGTK